MFSHQTPCFVINGNAENFDTKHFPHIICIKHVIYEMKSNFKDFSAESST